MFKDKLSKHQVKGSFGIYLVKDSWELIHEQHNIVVNSAADILARAISGKAVINGMYMAFENDPGADKYIEAVGNNKNYYAVPANDRSFVRVTTLGEPIIETTDAKYAGNKITFLGVTDGTSFFPSVPLTDSVSVLYHTALVSMKEGGGQDDDVIFSCSDFDIPVTKIAGAQLGLRWSLNFE